MPIDEPSVALTFEAMKRKLSRIVPEAELKYKAELVYEIQQLKRERKALVLGHNYMEAALFHTIPDIVGDSLYLAREAARAQCEAIVFCGVQFMAETAKILNPQRRVLIPSAKAGCSLASSITAQDVRELKKAFPGAPVITYVNTYADVKAESDICVTSGNAARVLNACKERVVLFLPDKFMAQNLGQEIGRAVVLANPNDYHPTLPDGPVVVGWNGSCEVHERFTPDDVISTRAQFPGVKVVTHPEAPPEVVQASDFSGGTQDMVKFVQSTKAPHFLILTECSMGDNIIAENPEKDILRLCSVRCPHMNQITLEDTALALRNLQFEVQVPEEIRTRALGAVQRMLVG